MCAAVCRNSGGSLGWVPRSERPAPNGALPVVPTQPRGHRSHGSNRTDRQNRNAMGIASSRTRLPRLCAESTKPGCRAPAPAVSAPTTGAPRSTASPDLGTGTFTDMRRCQSDARAAFIIFFPCVLLQKLIHASCHSSFAIIWVEAAREPCLIGTGSTEFFQKSPLWCIISRLLALPQT